MHLSRHSTAKVFSAITAFLVACTAFSPSMAQKNILKETQEAREMINDLKEIEKELRQQLQEDIQEKREDTLDYLTRLEKKYRRNDKNDEANSIKKEIKKLRKQFEKNEPTEPEDETPIADEEEDQEGNDYVIFEKKYGFKSQKISGYLIFKIGNKVEVNYSLNGEKQRAEFTAQIKSNHLFLDTKSNLGKIYISEIPDTERLAIMIRWGGTIKHQISKASIK